MKLFKSMSERLGWKLDRVPIILRGLSGFNSCLTVVFTSLIYIYSVRERVILKDAEWPETLKLVIMVMGPIILAWHFVNAKSIISTILIDNEEGNVHKEIKEEDRVLPKNNPILTENDVAFDREVYGSTTVMLRSVAGFIATQAICITSILYVWTIHEAILRGAPLPDKGDLLIMNIGPIITSWNFIKAGNTLSTVLSSNSAISNLKKRAIKMLSD